MKNAPVGSTVLFLAPSQQAVLEGYIVQRKPMSEMFPDYEENPQYGYSADTIYYQIRVFAVRDLLEDVVYKPPQLCKVPAKRVKHIINENAEFAPPELPKEVTLDTFPD